MEESADVLNDIITLMQAYLLSECRNRTTGVQMVQKFGTLLSPSLSLLNIASHLVFETLRTSIGPKGPTCRAKNIHEIKEIEEIKENQENQGNP